MKAIIKEGELLTLENAKRRNIRFEFEGGHYSLKYADDEFLYLLGFREVEEPTLTEHQLKDSFYLDETSDTIKFNVIDLSIEEIEGIEKVKKKNQRNELLVKGIIVQEIWFNEEKLTQFTVMAQMMSSMGVTSMEWGKEGEDGSTVWGEVEVPNEAFLIIQEASTMFSQIYKEHIL